MNGKVHMMLLESYITEKASINFHSRHGSPNWFREASHFQVGASSHATPDREADRILRVGPSVESDTTLAPTSSAIALN